MGISGNLGGLPGERAPLNLKEGHDTCSQDTRVTSRKRCCMEGNKGAHRGVGDIAQRAHGGASPGVTPQALGTEFVFLDGREARPAVPLADTQARKSYLKKQLGL